MSKIFNVYLNSTQKISGNNNDATYFIDWSSVLPRGKYRCSFGLTMTSSNISLVNANLKNIQLFYSLILVVKEIFYIIIHQLEQ